MIASIEDMFALLAKSKTRTTSHEATVATYAKLQMHGVVVLFSHVLR